MHSVDNLTHGLLGAAIGMLRPRDGGPEHDAPASHTDRAVVWACFLAAEAPDLDVFFGSGPMAGLAYHRGWTHSLAAAPLMALVAAGLTRLIWRRARFRTVFLWSLAAVVFGHLVNDWMTGWGTRLLLPWSEARLALDWVPIVDLLYTLPLLAAVLLAWRRPRLRQRAMLAVLAYLAVYGGGYRGAASALVSRAVGHHYAGRPVQQVRVAPDLFNPLAWQFTVDLGDRYEQGRAYPFGPIRPLRVEAKPPEDDVLRAVRQAPELKPFFDQFSFPLVSYRPAAGGYQVTLGDVRYQMPGRGLSYQVFLGPDLQVRSVGRGRE